MAWQLSAGSSNGKKKWKLKTFLIGRLNFESSTTWIVRDVKTAFNARKVFLSFSERHTKMREWELTKLDSTMTTIRTKTSLKFMSVSKDHERSEREEVWKNLKLNHFFSISTVSSIQNGFFSVCNWTKPNYLRYILKNYRNRRKKVWNHFLAFYVKSNTKRSQLKVTRETLLLQT